MPLCSFYSRFFHPCSYIGLRSWRLSRLAAQLPGMYWGSLAVFDEVWRNTLKKSKSSEKLGKSSIFKETSCPRKLSFFGDVIHE